MNIALIGAPGSGKTNLAYQLSTKLAVYDEDCGCQGHNIKIIDGYIPEIETKTQIALGPTTSYLGNLYVALERYARERVARLNYEIVITCGTLVETAVYTALNFVSLAEVMPDEARAEEAPRIESVIRMLAVLYNDIVEYNYAFYLPPHEPDENAKFIDQQLQAGLEGFKLVPVTALTNHETRLQDALKTLGREDASQ